MSGSGARYADAEGNEQWTKGMEDGRLTLAGEPPRAVQIADEDAIDAVWDEPVAFDGCSSGAAGAGTAPDQPQPVHLVRRAARQAPTPPGATA